MSIADRCGTPLILRVMGLAADGTLLLSPSDLSAHLACPHLSQLELQVQRGELERAYVRLLGGNS